MNKTINKEWKDQTDVKVFLVVWIRELLLLPYFTPDYPTGEF